VLARGAAPGSPGMRSLRRELRGELAAGQGGVADGGQGQGGDRSGGGDRGQDDAGQVQGEDRAVGAGLCRVQSGDQPDAERSGDPRYTGSVPNLRARYAVAASPAPRASR